jgi:ATP-dependent RNA helicase
MSNKTSQFSISHAITPIDTFDDLPISDALLRGIYGYGFERPSGVQRVALPAVLSAETPDVIVQARSGSGKTCVFAIAALHVASTKNRVALILSPTRELAEQSGKVARALGDAVPLVHVHVATGGHKVENLGTAPQRGLVLSGTPGRVAMLLKDLRLVELWKNISLVVLDEADELLMKDQGFKDQIREIFRRIHVKNDKVQKLLVSATLPQEVLELTQELMHEPVRILMKTEELTVKEIKQYIYKVDKEEFKFQALCDLYDRISVTQSIIFCNTKTKVDWLHKKLVGAKFPASFIHGDMTQKDRDSVIAKFRAGSVRVLVTTDIIGRGIDVQSVSLVVCYDLPVNRELYLHRIGRSGRFGRKGMAINLVTEDDNAKIQELEKFYAITIPELPKY